MLNDSVPPPPLNRKNPCLSSSGRPPHGRKRGPNSVRSSKPEFPQNKLKNQGAGSQGPHSSKRKPLDFGLNVGCGTDEDEVTNFLIEENLRHRRRYFGASLKHPGNNFNGAESAFQKDGDEISSSGHNGKSSLLERNPTLGEIIRGKTKPNFKEVPKVSPAPGQIYPSPPYYFAKSGVFEQTDFNVPVSQKTTVDIMKARKSRCEKTSQNSSPNRKIVHPAGKNQQNNNSALGLHQTREPKEFALQRNSRTGNEENSLFNDNFRKQGK